MFDNGYAGLALLRLRERVVNDPSGALSDWKENDGALDHCSWFGVQCSDGKVVLLNIARSEDKDTVQSRLLQELAAPAPFINYSKIFPPYSQPPGPPSSVEPSIDRNVTRGGFIVDPSNNNTESPNADPSHAPAPTPSNNNTVLPNASVPTTSGSKSSGSSSKHRTILLASIGGAVFLLVVIVGTYLFKTSKVSTVKPWATGLSGQLQKAFVTGVPKLKRSELVAACEDFSNVIGSSTIGTVYKGTLSNGVEIAVASVAVKSDKDWSKNLETQFRKKIDTLSKVNHKNFVNLLGYCEEDEPFTRMMVFEYAPNGTLFEHLHIKESEHLDWAMRLRIIMGMAYCLEHIHQLNPPIPHNNLNSSAVNLTEDYAAKISDPCFWNEITASDREADRKNIPDSPLESLESNVYSFGVLLFEIVTGRMPYLVDDGSLEDWASDYLRRDQPLTEMVDPTLNSFDREQLEKLGEVIKSCCHPEPRQRPDMKEVGARLREITAITPDGAIPKLSPLWWAELEIMSAEAS
ncbi:hypothetical protein CCACVL1_30670 [Corchorus capsularis]|uniref:Protein kinase domain-containing protein n=1 Tax=Corchorus capsularis TaxID=210143 RepID=A0A1R3FW73_COCAP|nr:hypothetical protein CCACVL1_30670 [Corchorus capsularis]